MLPMQRLIIKVEPPATGSLGPNVVHTDFQSRALASTNMGSSEVDLSSEIPSEAIDFDTTLQFASGQTTTISNGKMQDNPDGPSGTFMVSFTHVNEQGSSIQYNGVLHSDDHIIIGTTDVLLMPWDKTKKHASFLFLKTVNPAALCYQPLQKGLGSKNLWSFLRDIVCRHTGTGPVIAVKRYLELSYRTSRKWITATENEEFSALRQSFMFMQVSALEETQDVLLIKELWNTCRRAKAGLEMALKAYTSTPMKLDPGKSLFKRHQVMLTKITDHVTKELETSSPNGDSESPIKQSQEVFVLHEFCIHNNPCVGSDKSAQFICNKCEDEIEELCPWEFQNQYQAEVKDVGHTMLHLQVRFRPESDEGATSVADEENQNLSPTRSTHQEADNEEW
ncbi:hypothetical protein C8J56DRAFT_892357 [Mycena floridula]|nr:hypothetical protein C8J56DRAFT_892357 [Mycena floridula]